MVRVVGNLKFDNLHRETSVKKEDLGFREQDRLFIAGSTYPGEEKIVLDVYNSLKIQFPFTPDHRAPAVERANEVARLCGYVGLLPQKFSDNPVTFMADASTVLIIDRIGYLRDLYGLADVVFIGKSLRGAGGKTCWNLLLWVSQRWSARARKIFGILSIFLRPPVLCWRSIRPKK